MLGTSARLLRLLTLFQSRPIWAGPELTQRLEVTARTLRRDVDRLRSLGYPVHSTSGPAGGYQLGAGAALPPLMLDNHEALAVAVALHQTAGADGSGVAEAGQRALAKLDQVLPGRVRKRLGALRAALVRVPTPAAPSVELGVVDALAAACAEHRVVQFGYRDHQARITRRTVEPHRLVLVERRWYLAAWDRARLDWRTFRVDRVAAPVELGTGFVPRAAPEDDVAGYVMRSTSWRSHPHQARVLFHAPAAALRAKIPPAYGTITAVGARRCRLETGGSSLDGIAVWLAVTGFPFQVESPPALAQQVRVLGARLSRAGRAGSS